MPLSIIFGFTLAVDISLYRDSLCLASKEKRKKEIITRACSLGIFSLPVKTITMHSCLPFIYYYFKRTIIFYK